MAYLRHLEKSIYLPRPLGIAAFDVRRDKAAQPITEMLGQTCFQAGEDHATLQELQRDHADGPLNGSGGSCYTIPQMPAIGICAAPLAWVVYLVNFGKHAF